MSGDHQGERFGTRELQRVLRVMRELELPVRLLEQFRDEHAGLAIVVDYEDSLHVVAFAFCAAADGRSSVKTVPRPGSLRTAMDPPWLTTTSRVMLRPRPVPRPAGFVVTQGSNTRGSTSAGMPAPVSLTVNRTPSVARDAAISSCPPRGIASSALLTRFSSASSSWTGSALNPRQFTVDLQPHIDAGRAQRGPGDLANLFDERRHVDALRLQGRSPRVIEHGAHGRHDPPDLGLNGLEALERVARRPRILNHQLHVARNQVQRRADLVRHVGGHLPERGHLLGPGQRFPQHQHALIAVDELGVLLAQTGRRFVDPSAEVRMKLLEAAEHAIQAIGDRSHFVGTVDRRAHADLAGAGSFHGLADGGDRPVDEARASRSTSSVNTTIAGKANHNVTRRPRALSCSSEAKEVVTVTAPIACESRTTGAAMIRSRPSPVVTG